MGENTRSLNQARRGCSIHEKNLALGLGYTNFDFIPFLYLYLNETCFTENFKWWSRSHN